MVAISMMLAFLPSCFRWQEQGPTPRAAMARIHPATARITRVDQSKVVVHRPSLSADSIVGEAESAKHDTATTRIAVPLSQVASVATHRFDPLKTLAAGAGGTVFVLAVICFIDDCIPIPDPS
jgi:hypothetical protein